MQCAENLGLYCCIKTPTSGLGAYLSQFNSNDVVFHPFVYHGTWLSTCLNQDCSYKNKQNLMMHGNPSIKRWTKPCCALSSRGRLLETGKYQSLCYLTNQRNKARIRMGKKWKLKDCCSLCLVGTSIQVCHLLKGLERCFVLNTQEFSVDKISLIQVVLVFVVFLQVKW